MFGRSRDELLLLLLAVKHFEMLRAIHQSFRNQWDKYVSFSKLSEVRYLAHVPTLNNQQDIVEFCNITARDSTRKIAIDHERVKYTER